MLHTGVAYHMLHTGVAYHMLHTGVAYHMLYRTCTDVTNFELGGQVGVCTEEAFTSPGKWSVL